MSTESNCVAPTRALRKSKARIFTQEEEAEIRAMFNYDPDTGAITYKINRSGSYKKAGERAETRGSSCPGYERWTVSFKKKNVMAHRVAFFLMEGRWPSEIDHIDNNPLNNAWTNIRECTRDQNVQNRAITKRNTSGYKGVYRVRGRNLKKPFNARIQFDGKTISLGLYSSVEEAGEAFLSAALFSYGEFANLDSPLLD